jgi:hypothetical protein
MDELVVFCLSYVAENMKNCLSERLWHSVVFKAFKAASFMSAT